MIQRFLHAAAPEQAPQGTRVNDRGIALAGVHEMRVLQDIKPSGNLYAVIKS